MKNNFLNCLRIQIVPGHYEEERIDDIVSFCAEYGFNNVMLFINAEEYNVAHMTIEEAAPWVETMKRAKRKLVEHGISVSLNPWMELGHLDRARPLKEGQNFLLQTDYDGREAKSVVCPFCKEWRAYFKEFYTYLLCEIQPDTVWVEDDFRLHNHDPLRYGGCFCAEHMRRYNEKLKKNYTREQFTDLLFRKQGKKAVRKAWLDVNREAMADLADFIGKTVKAAGSAKVGLMSSMHTQHATEGRDWFAVHKGLAQGGEMIDRLHLPCYKETSSKEYYYLFNLYPYICRAFLPEKCKVLPELENGAFGTYTKEARFVQFQLESSIPLCVEGMTYDIFDFVGNGTMRSFGYGEAVKAITPYMNAAMRLPFRYGDLEGIVCPVDEKSVYHRENVKSFEDLYPDEHHFYAYLNAVGLSTKISKKKRFLGKTVALSCGAVYNFTKKQLEDLFANNFVVLEGGAATRLIDRGLGVLIGAVGYELQGEGVNSYEQVCGDFRVNDRLGYRATMFAKAGKYVKLSYAAGARRQVLSEVYDYKNAFVGDGFVQGKNYLLIPFVIDSFYSEQFNDLRTALLRRAAAENTACLVSTGYAGLHAYLFRKKEKSAIVLVNATIEDLKDVTLTLKGVDGRRVRTIDRTDGKTYLLNAKIENESLTLPSTICGMTTRILLID